MYEILKKRELAENVIEYTFLCPLLAKHAEPGQFVILRVTSDGERVPFTICDFDREKGTVTVLVQTVGATTMQLAALSEGESVCDLVGPLGNATDLSKYKSVLLVGGGIGTAVIMPQAKKLFAQGVHVEAIIGARTASLVMYEQEMRSFTNRLHVVTDDGSKGEKGFVTTKLEALVKAGEHFDVVFAVGPLVMMRATAALTKTLEIPTVVSMNSIMVDGTGMCGCCRLSVGGVTKYACVDGPEFDGHQVDFNEAITRSKFYAAQEKEHVCRLKG